MSGILREAMRDLDEMVRTGGMIRLEKSIAWTKRKAAMYAGYNPRGSVYLDDAANQRMRRLMDGEDVPEATAVEIGTVKNKLSAAADEIESLVTFHALDEPEEEAV